MLMVTIDAARRVGLVKASSVDKVIVDTTVMPKAIAHPTDSRLLEKSRQQLIKLATEQGLSLRQNYNRQAPRLAVQVGRYAHARQFKRMKKTLRTEDTRGARVSRSHPAARSPRAIGARESARPAGAYRPDPHAADQGQEQAVCAACARSGVHQQGQGQNAV